MHERRRKRSRTHTHFAQCLTSISDLHKTGKRKPPLIWQNCEGFFQFEDVNELIYSYTVCITKYILLGCVGRCKFICEFIDFIEAKS